MEPSLLDDAEFWLPPEFLTDEDFLMEKENKVLKGIKTGDALRFVEDVGSKFSFPFQPRYGFGSLGSPVESLVGSTETESDEENYLAGLTRQMAHSTLEDDLSGRFGGHQNFQVDNNSKGWSQSGSPQSTLCAAGFSCSCRQRSDPNCQSRVVSPAAVTSAWDMYCATAEELSWMKSNNESYGYSHGGREFLGQPRKLSPVPVAANNPNIGSGFYNHPSLTYPKLQLQPIQFQQLKQQQMMKHRQVMLNRGRVSGNNGGSVGYSPSAWPNLHHPQQLRNGSGMPSVLPGNPTGKRVSNGTGVFLPRRVSSETRKKQTPPTVFVPARVTQALNLNLDSSAAQPMVQPRLESQTGLNDASLRLRKNNVKFSGQKRGGFRTEQQAVSSNELRLPQDWSY